MVAVAFCRLLTVMLKLILSDCRGAKVILLVVSFSDTDNDTSIVTDIAEELVTTADTVFAAAYSPIDALGSDTYMFIGLSIVINFSPFTSL